MLSATGKGRTKMLTNSAHEALHKILERNVSSRPTVGAELNWHPPITVLSNNCVDASNSALGNSICGGEGLSLQFVRPFKTSSSTTISLGTGLSV